jgi:3-hydroxyisobutyrate dehydrogenase
MTAKHSLGWIGMGRMGFPMAERLLKAGHPLSIWNRTRAKAELLGAKGGKIVDRPCDLSGQDVVFSMVSTGQDLEQIYFGSNGLVTGGSASRPRILVDCSSIGIEQSEAIRADLKKLGCEFISAPVSGNGKCVKAGKLSSVVSGPKAAFDAIEPYLAVIAASGVSYVGEGELARICKIAHNVFLGVVIQNLAEITILAQKAGVPRHAFLDFMNASVMGSTFSKYKSNALVNLDWTTTFTPALLRKDLDLGLKAARDLDVPMPVTAAMREALQSHFGAATLQKDPAAYLEKDFSALLETVALASGVKLEPENVPMPTGLEVAG